ncbi:Gfo/Idh/MocA family protein [Paenibacillus glycinis]|uniref:Gfo/Idh/MocA family oxidoreductase n=1 Tax=Paenibacillus glycinis TaxID=2697035 RepID=A0ABW9XUC1_9BACL|nr:Gfo/Idh/MocA family oxidoreductase [Paenibacillus glycinis]NBD26272.1 Gfo/Idh/MocA family oxidoreductase [Paenibacillus glycinis]
MSNPLGIGVVGAGAIATRLMAHLRLPDTAGKVKLAAVCDPVPGRAEAAAARYGAAAGYESYEELLRDPSVDIVTICSPIGLHYEQGVMAIEAGKHVHFNKTMTTTTADADDLIRRAAAANVRLVASPGMMINQASRRKRKLYLEGALGQLAWAITGTTMGDGAYHLNEDVRTGSDVLSNVNPGWYFRKPGGGPIYDATVYPLHELTGILGPAKRVTALSGIGIPEHWFGQERIETEMDDSTILLLDFGQAVHAVVYSTIAGAATEWAPSIYGTKGALVGSKFGDEPLKLEDDRLPHVSGEHAELREAHVYEDIMQLVRWVREDIPSVANAEHARHVIEIIESGYRAAETGITQELRTTFEPLALSEL